MKNKEQGYQSSWQRLKERYHLSVVNKSLLVEVYSRDISKGRLMAAVSLIGIMIVSFTYCLIAFTPLKSIIIPGHETEETRMELFALQAEVIKLQQQVNGKISYSMKLDSNLTKFGIPVDSINNMNLKKVASQNDNKLVLPDQFLDLAESKSTSVLAYYHFFNPISGLISKAFKLDEGHYGVDVVAEKNEAVKATLNGKVVFSAWTAETGHVIAVQHANDLLSIYKHNSVVLKKEGDIVKAGEVIAIVGNSGDFTTGPHLHFEIWLNGQPLNPAEIMKFN